MDQFRLEKSGAVVRLTLTRPDKHNAFDDTLIAGLTDALASIDQDETVGILVLAAEGKSFSAGADLDWMKRAAAQSREANHADAAKLAGLMRTLNFLSKTTIALVQGPAYGGGVGLVAACDIAVASSAAKFSLTEVRLGLIPSAISPYVVAAIGARQARRYFQTAEMFDASEALRIGLVHEVVEPAALAERGDTLVSALKTTAPYARGQAKRLVFDVGGREVDDALTEMTAGRIAEIRAGAEAREGLDAFFGKRKPAWLAGGE